MKVFNKKLSELKQYEFNNRKHPEEQVKRIAKSIKEFGFNQPILIDKDGEIIAGHGRYLASLSLGLEEVPCVYPEKELSEKEIRALRVLDNKLQNDSTWDFENVSLELDWLEDSGLDLDEWGLGDLRIEESTEEKNIEESNTLRERFGIPPFSVFDARQGEWQERKRYWKAQGIESELGRDEDLLAYSDLMKKNMPSNTSVFDPVLCEILYLWFTKKEMTILDPFCGGSVRGIVSAMLGRNYIGVDISKDQIEENIKQSKKVCKDLSPIYINGDSEKDLPDGSFDFLFSCPPYGDLEKYSDNIDDLSNMNNEDFLCKYRSIIEKSAQKLKDNAFACFVVGDYRDKKGNLSNFVSNTIKAFLDSGLNLYNEAILVTAVGNLQLRAAKPFETSRKISKTHQNVLIFLKGDAKKATEKLGAIELLKAAENG
jgi:ParB-like chromosome segregation protein Spo0J/DNA modification methylase